MRDSFAATATSLRLGSTLFEPFICSPVIRHMSSSEQEPNRSTAHYLLSTNLFACRLTSINFCLF